MLKEQIAHDLTMIYMKNRYGINVYGSFYIDSDNGGSGEIKTEHYPCVNDPKYSLARTGERGFLGIEKRKKVQSGNKTDVLFAEMVENYYAAYTNIFQLLCEKESELEKQTQD